MRLTFFAWRRDLPARKLSGLSALVMSRTITHTRLALPWRASIDSTVVTSVRLPSEDLMADREPLSGHDKADADLLAVRPVVAAVLPLQGRDTVPRISAPSHADRDVFEDVAASQGGRLGRRISKAPVLGARRDCPGGAD